MPVPADIRNEIDTFRSERPSLANWDDERIYRSLKRKNPNLAWSEVDSKAKKKKEANINPSYMNGFKEWFDYGIDENSADWMKVAYNNSLTGLTEQAISGEARHEVDLNKYDPEIWQDVASMALSFVMPLDLLALGAGGGAGALALKGLGVNTAHQAAKFSIKQSLKERMVEGAVRMGSTMSSYEGAMGGMTAAVNDEDVLMGTAKGLMHGGIVGGLAGAAGGGMAWKYAERLNKYTKAGKIASGVGKDATQKLSALEKFKLRSTGELSQVVGEDLTYNAVELTEQVAKGEDIRWRDVGVGMLAELGLFGVTKGGHKLFQKSAQQYKLLEEAEKMKHAVDKDGKTKTAQQKDQLEVTLRENARIIREEGGPDAELDAIASENAADAIAKSKTGIDDIYIKFKDDLDQSKGRLQDIII